MPKPPIFGAILDTRWMSYRIKRNLAYGLEARWTELVSAAKAGYGSDMTKGSREELISDARQAFALGLIAYLPKWAKPDA